MDATCYPIEIDICKHDSIQTQFSVIILLCYVLKYLFLLQVGNGWIDDNLCTKGMYDYFWMAGLNSDETHEGIDKLCDFGNFNYTNECNLYQSRANDELGNIDIYNIYAPFCNSSATKTSYSVSCIPCSWILHLFILYEYEWDGNYIKFTEIRN